MKIDFVNPEQANPPRPWREFPTNSIIQHCKRGSVYLIGNKILRTSNITQWEKALLDIFTATDGFYLVESNSKDDSDLFTLYEGKLVLENEKV